MSSQSQSPEIDGALVLPFCADKSPPHTCADEAIGARVGKGNITEIPTPNARPRVRDVVQPERTGSKVELAIEPGALAGIFGVNDTDVATHLLNQLVRVLHPDPSKPINPETINLALGLIEGIAPKDALEAMIAVLIVGAQHAAMDVLRRGLHPDQSHGGRQTYSALGLKAARTVGQLVATLNHHRGKGPVQHVVVERITVEPGGRAIVGAVDARKGGGGQ